MLQVLQRKGPLSRADLSRELDVMRSTAGNLVTQLQFEGLLRDAGDESADPLAQPRMVGRPGSLVELNPHHAAFLGAEVGVGYIRVVMLALGGAQSAVAHEDIDVARQNPEQSAETLVHLVRRVMADHASAPVLGLCVAIPGLVEHDGTVLRAPPLGWPKVRFLDLLRDGLPEIPQIFGENDANAFAIAELQNGWATDIAANAIFIWLDAGVGAAVRAEGRVIRGHRGYAGELGFMYVGTEHSIAGTHVPGSMESAVGRKATLARYRRHGGDGSELKGLLDGYDAGRRPAVETAREWSDAMAQGLANLVNLLNPAQIIFGGSVSAFAARCLDLTSARLQGRLLDSSLAPSLMIAKTGDQGAAIGSALLIHNAYLDFNEAETPYGQKGGA